MGFQSKKLFNESLSFIKVNGIDYQRSDFGWWRGLMIVTLDQNNPSILIESKTFDIWIGYHNESRYKLFKFYQSITYCYNSYS